jgi:hypothetical protein
MYLRETRRRNRDGSTVSYRQLAHNERHPETGAPTAKVIHNFGRAEAVDRAGLARLVASISRFLDPADAVAAVAAAQGTAGGQIEVLDCRWMGGAWVLPGVRAHHPRAGERTLPSQTRRGLPIPWSRDPGRARGAPYLLGLNGWLMARADM